jgi:hypothetical protein
MLEPEYRVGFRILIDEIGLLPTLKISIPSLIKGLGIRYRADEKTSATENKKTAIKNHFKLLALLYRALQKRCGTERTDEIMQRILMEGGRVFFRGFRAMRPGEDLRDFAEVYKAFESNNIVFHVIEESHDKLELVIKRCFIYEAFNELGIGRLTRWMCDIAFAYFREYHPRMTYTKDRMIARGDETCHEVFIWQ